MKLVSNWSFFMLPLDSKCIIAVQRIDLLTLSRIIDSRDIECHVPGSAMVRFLNNELGTSFQSQKKRFILENCEQLIVAQYCGPSFDPDTNEMPDRAKFVFFLVKLMPRNTYVTDNEGFEVPDFNMFDLGDIPVSAKEEPVSQGYSAGYGNFK